MALRERNTRNDVAKALEVENLITSLEISLQQAKNIQNTIRKWQISTSKVQNESAVNENSMNSLSTCSQYSDNEGNLAEEKKSCRFNKKRNVGARELIYSRPYIYYTFGEIEDEVNENMDVILPESIDNHRRTDGGRCIRKYPAGRDFSEFFVICDPSVKCLLMLGFINQYFQRVICVTNSDECTHHLCLILSEISNITVRELSSDLSSVQCERILEQFGSSAKDILVCSDVVARSVAVKKVDCIFYYNTAVGVFTEHVGIKAFVIVTLLGRLEVRAFGRMMHLAGKVKVSADQLRFYFDCSVVSEYELALYLIAEAAEKDSQCNINC